MAVNDENEQQIVAGILTDDKVIAQVMEAQIKMSIRDAQWKRAAEVLNIYSLIIHVFVVLMTLCFVFLDARQN